MDRKGLRMRERAGEPHRALILDKVKDKETVGDSHLGKNNDSVTICCLNREKKRKGIL